MEENKIKEIFTIIEMFETTLCALKWHRHNSSAFLEIDSIMAIMAPQIPTIMAIMVQLREYPDNKGIHAAITISKI